MKEWYIEKKHKAIIELLKKELLYDITNTAYILADTERKADTDGHQLHNIFDIAVGGNRDKLARILDASVEDCKEFLFRYTKVEICGDGYDSDDWMECVGAPEYPDNAYYIAMRLPHDFSKTSVHTLTVLLHDYVVYQTMYEWLVMVKPEYAERYKVLLEEKKQKIKDASNRSAGHVRIKLHPF